MSEGLDSGLFGISIDSDSEDSTYSPEAGGAQSNGASSTETTKKTGTARVAQTEEDYQTVKDAYRVKVENGEIWKTIKLPLGPLVTKQDAQAVLHAVEELHFGKRYQEGVEFVKKLLDDDVGGNGLDEDTRTLLRYYEKKCAHKAV